MALAESADYGTSGWVREKTLNQKIKRQRTVEAEGDGVNYVGKKTALLAMRTMNYGKVTLSPLWSTIPRRIPHGTTVKIENHMQTSCPISCTTYSFYYILIRNVVVVSFSSGTQQDVFGVDQGEASRHRDMAVVSLFRECIWIWNRSNFTVSSLQFTMYSIKVRKQKGWG